MDYYKWDSRKNELGISFEQIVLHIERGEVLDVFEHPNKEQYPGQQVLVVEVNGYAYAVPFVESPEGRLENCNPN
jgi:hypothetical protein